MVVSFRRPCRGELLLCLLDMTKAILESRCERLWIDMMFCSRNIEMLDVLIELDMSDTDYWMWKMSKDQFIIFLMRMQQQLLRLGVLKPLSACIRNEKPQIEGDVLYVDSFYSSLKTPSISVVFIGLDKKA